MAGIDEKRVRNSVEARIIAMDLGLKMKIGLTIQ